MLLVEDRTRCVSIVDRPCGFLVHVWKFIEEMSNMMHALAFSSRIGL
jgi:hypothetical protein